MYTNDPRIDTGEDYTAEDPAGQIAPHLLQMVQARAGKRILDLGCGTGGYAYHLGRNGFDVVAVDRNPKYVEIACGLGVDARIAAGQQLPFEDKSFDSVICIEVLEHIPSHAIASFLHEARRVTNGNMLITVPDSTQYAELIKHEFQLGHYRAKDHVQFFTAETLRALLVANFRKVSVLRCDPLYPHRLLPPVVRRPLSVLYRVGLLRPTIFSRLFAEASQNV